MLGLTLHPSETRTPRHRVRANAKRVVNSELITLGFEVEGASFVNLFPETENSVEAMRSDNLWKSTCFECFIGTASKSYSEWNFSPNGNWAAYTFADYRSEMKRPDVTAPTIEAHQIGERTRFSIDFTAPASTDFQNEQNRLILSLTAVIIESNDPNPFYWALAHSGKKPDFHLRESFTLELGF